MPTPVSLPRLAHALRVLLLCCCPVAAMSAPAERETAAYGAWRSGLTAEAVAAGGTRLDNVRVAGGRVYWTENQPTEGGRIALMTAVPAGGARVLSPSGSNVRTRVHEYGGAPYVVVGDSVIYSQYDDQRLYEQTAEGARRALTPVGYRYADCSLVGRAAARVLVCVREDHTDPQQVRNAIVRLNLDEPGAGDVLYDGADFVAYPRVSADGRSLAFIRWNHPQMPWDGTELVVAPLQGARLGSCEVVAGNRDEAVLEPQWDADGTLYFLSDRTDFWNLYAWSHGKVRHVLARAAESGGPLWAFGQSNYALLGDGRAVARLGVKGSDELALIDLAHGTARRLDLPYVRYAQFARIDSGHVAFLAASAREPTALVRLEIATGATAVLRVAGSPQLPRDAVSAAQSIEFPSAQGRTAHAFFYAPSNPGFVAPSGTRPPLVAFVHGGPTAQAVPDYSPSVQFWTNRGFAVVDVNYGGSSGFGRASRQRLNGSWGVVDVEDVVAAVRFLAGRGDIDPSRTAISGGSAGGYTVLVALSTSDVFHAGADYYGVSDMSALARDTHKFESRYLDSLIGPLPQAQAIYDSRSPLNHLDGFRVPLIVFQGADDPVVPPNQSERIVDALRKRHAPVAYLLFAREGHGFRRAENIVRALQAELSFYGQVFGFRPADALPELAIENLPATAP